MLAAAGNECQRSVTIRTIDAASNIPAYRTGYATAHDSELWPTGWVAAPCGGRPAEGRGRRREREEVCVCRGRIVLLDEAHGQLERWRRPVDIVLKCMD